MRSPKKDYRGQGEFSFMAKSAPARPAVPHFDNPQCDNEALLNAQYDYIQGDKSALTRLYNIGIKVALRMIQTLGRDNFLVRNLSLDDKWEKAHDAICYVITRYLEDGAFAVQKNMTSYIYLCVKKEVYRHSKGSELVTINADLPIAMEGL